MLKSIYFARTHKLLSYLQAGSLRQSQCQTLSGHIQLETQTSFNCEQQSIALSFLRGGMIRVWAKIIIAAVSNLAALNFRDLCFYISSNEKHIKPSV